MRNEERKVIGFKLVGSEYFGSGSIEIVILLPRCLPLPSSLIAVEPGVVVYQIPISVDLVVLINIPVICLASFEDNGLRCFFLCEIEVVEVDNGGSAGVSSEGRIAGLDIGQKFILIAEQELSYCSGSGKTVKSDVDADIADILIKIGIDRTIPQLLDK